MSTLEPKTRTEQFYDAILSGDTSELPTPCTREEVFLRQIAENGSGGGSSLPEVTAEDNGKVLSVVEGAWNKADANRTIVINGFHDRNRVSSLDINQGQIFDLLMDGKEIVIDAVNNTDHYLYKPIIFGSNIYHFMCLYWASGKFNVEDLVINKNNKNNTANYTNGTISFDS